MAGQVGCARIYKSWMWVRNRESGAYNVLVDYRRALKETTRAYKPAKRKFEETLMDHKAA